MKELNELLELAKVCHVIGAPVRLSDSQVEAIAEAFRALEQESQKNLNGALAWQQRAEAAEAKLAELEKQEPVAWTSKANLDTLKSEPRKTLEFMTGDKSILSNPVPLYARPVPAVSLTELVPHIGSSQVNDAAWVLHDRLGEYGPLTGGQFNNIKGCFYDALKVCMGVKP